MDQILSVTHTELPTEKHIAFRGVMSNEKFQGVDLQVARTPEENAD